MSDEHASRLAAWMVNTIGRALGIGALVGLGISIVGGLIDPDWIPLGIIAGPLVFAVLLAQADAPAPEPTPPQSS